MSRIRRWRRQEDRRRREPGQRSRRALALVEAHRLILHPAVVACAPLTGLTLLLAAANPDQDFLSYKLAIGGVVLHLAIGVLVAAGLAASRDRRSRTDELFASMPMQPAARSAALIAGLAPAVLLAAMSQAALVVALRAWNGLDPPTLPTGGAVAAVTVALGPAAMLQGPVLVAFGGVLGIAIGRRFPGVLVTFVVGIGVVLLWPALLWWDWEWQRFLLPLAHDLRTAGTVDLDSGRSALVVQGTTAGALAWHIAYLAGWTVLLAGVALLGAAPRRRAVLIASGSACATAAGVLQIAAWGTG